MALVFLATIKSYLMVNKNRLSLLVLKCCQLVNKKKKRYIKKI